MSEFFVEVSAAPLLIEADGSKMFVVEAIRDLSKEMNLSHEQRLSEIGMLAAGVAHEIRNPLASIQLGILRLDDVLSERSYPQLTSYLQVISDEIDRCIDVTDRLLRLSQPPSEFSELVSLNVIVPEVMSLLAAEAEHSKVNVAISFEKDFRIIATDSEMRMVVLNLAQNAFHAMPNGGSLWINGRASADKVLLCFEDNGAGISPEYMRLIFEPFWSRRADGVHGTGLGLAICREIIKRYDGSIRVSSEVGRGSQFVVVLPWADAAPQSR